MNKKWMIIITIAVIAGVVGGAYLVLRKPPEAFTPAFTDADGTPISGSIAAIETVNLGGFEQTITIRGLDASNPVLLHLHGGPGMPSSPWATWNGYFSELEKHFVLVHWDQRGAGKSYSKELTPKDMELENFINDTLELTEILRQRFNQDKIFLWGHSWGSTLGFDVLQVDSSPYYAYFASGTRVDWNTGIELAHQKAYEMARQADDTETLEALDSIQPFDPTDMEDLEVHFQVLAQYLINDFHTPGMEDAWLAYVTEGNSPEYPSNTIRPTLAGLDFTRGTIYQAAFNGFNLSRDFPRSGVPVHFLHGRYDYACPGVPVEEYYQSLEAPDKSFTWFENSAHNIFYEESDLFSQTVIQIADEILAAYNQ